MSNEQKPETTNQPQALDPIARRHARQYAVQAMYQWQLADSPLVDIEAEFLQYRIDKKTDLDYFKALIHGVPAHLSDIDREIRGFLSRPFSEIDPIELAILRLAIYELRERADVPYRVIINEALELAKKFGSIEGYKFVNGILDKIAKKLRPAEIGMTDDKRRS